MLFSPLISGPHKRNSKVYFMTFYLFNRLGFFERKSQFYSQPQLTMEIVKHYTNQGIKQLYVLVLGLDVIGNPFGFVRGVSTGVKDFFYEPYQVRRQYLGLVKHNQGCESSALKLISAFYLL